MKIPEAVKTMREMHERAITEMHKDEVAALEVAIQVLSAAPNDPLHPCPTCGAMTTCCQAAKNRGETADALASVVERQSKTLTRLQHKTEEDAQVIADMRAKAAKETP